MNVFARIYVKFDPFDCIESSCMSYVHDQIFVEKVGHIYNQSFMQTYQTYSLHVINPDRSRRILDAW